MSVDPEDADAMVARVRRRILVVSALAITAAFVVGWRPGVSLTIAAAVVILSFLVLEKLTDRLVPRQEKPRWRVLLPLLLVTVASFLALGAVLWRWKGFDPVAGALGLSVVVVSVAPEIRVRR